MFQKKEVESENWRHENMIYKPSVCDMSLSSVYANRVKRKKKKKSAVHLVKFLFLVVLAGLHFKA